MKWETFLKQLDENNNVVKNMDFHVDSPSLFQREVTLKGVRFVNCKFYMMRIDSVVMEGCEFKNCLFMDVLFKHAKIQNNEFIDCEFRNNKKINSTIKHNKFQITDAIEVAEEFIENN